NTLYFGEGSRLIVV
ncbi:mCG146450, partial [Mus musculus]